jgi:hypothetical protein
VIEGLPAYAWAALPLVIAAGAALLSAVLMEARLQVALARQQQSLVEARALLATQHRAMEERIKATEEATRRRALEEFLADVRLEERQYVGSQRRSLIIAERVCFRNVPLTPWIERQIEASAALPAAPAPAQSQPHALAAVGPRERRLLA